MSSSEFENLLNLIG